MSKKQLSSSTLLFRQGAMSWTFPVIIHERKLYNSLGTCTSIFSSDRLAGSAGNGVLDWSDWMARLRINAALNTCCVSSNTPLRLSSSGTPFHRQLFLFCSFLCLAQPQTSLNNWPWRASGCTSLLNTYCDSVHLLGLWKTNLMSKCLLIMWSSSSNCTLWQLFPVLHLAVTCHTYGTMWFNRLISTGDPLLDHWGKTFEGHVW